MAAIRKRSVPYNGRRAVWEGLAVALLSVATLSACGSADRGLARLGCHQYCQQAGSPQGNPTPVASIRIDTTGTVVSRPDATVPIQLTCRSSVPCKGGALLLAGPDNLSTPSLSVACAPGQPCLGRSDLEVGAHRTLTIAVPLSAPGRQLLDSYGRVSASVLVEFPTDAFESSERPISVALSRSAPAGAIIVSALPSAIGVGEGGAWVANEDDNTVTRIDTKAGRVLGAPIKVGVGPDAIAVGEGRVWVSNHGATSVTNRGVGSVSRIDASTGQAVGHPITVGNDQPEAIAVGRGLVWVALAYGSVTRIDATGQVVGHPITFGDSIPMAIAVDHNNVWVATSNGTLTRINASTGQKVGQPIDVGGLIGGDCGTVSGCPDAIAVGQGNIWVGVGNTVTRIDASTGQILGPPIRVGNAPEAIAVDQSGVWVANRDSNTVTRIDASSGDVLGKPIKVGVAPDGIAVSQGSVWVANAGAGTVTRIDASTSKVIPAAGP